MELISREDAKNKGLKRFFTGEPCPHGHTDEHYVGNWNCCQCTRDYSKEYVKNNPEKRKESNARHFEKHKEYHTARSRKYQGLPEATREYPMDGLCESCGNNNGFKKNGTQKSLCLDHCHTTGEFRGWLCYGCNGAEGNLKSSCRNIMKLHEYLMKFKCEQLLKNQIAGMVF
jgi:hypothetical protein